MFFQVFYIDRFVSRFDIVDKYSAWNKVAAEVGTFCNVELSYRELDFLTCRPEELAVSQLDLFNFSLAFVFVLLLRLDLKLDLKFQFKI